MILKLYIILYLYIGTNYIIIITYIAKPWITNNLISMPKTKHSLFNMYKNCQIPFYVYNGYKNNFTLLLKRAKRSYFVNKFNDCKSSLRDTWRNINNLIKTNKKIIVDNIVYNYNKITDKTLIVEIFNEYFNTIPFKLRNELPIVNKDPISFLGNRTAKTMDTKLATSQEVCSIILSLKNKSCKPNFIPTFIYKNVVSIVRVSHNL